ncbi:hypothetical protein EES45_35855 [Streptomyces sp. ADI97-07]|nr:hypothetical protein EES45_35855 [Streptomyces sp. ADI97-07]
MTPRPTGKPLTTSNARRKLAAPTVAMLPRIADSLSFLYLDIVRIHQDDTGIRPRRATGRPVGPRLRFRAGRRQPRDPTVTRPLEGHSPCPR